MLQYIVRRLLIGLLTLLGITIVTFVIIRLAPGDPAEMQIGIFDDPSVTAKHYDMLRIHFGLDKPWPEQYVLWLKRLVTLDFGNSFADQQAVGEKILQSLWPTLSVALISLFISLTLSLPIGIYSAYRQGGMFDRTASTLLYMLYSIPSYVMGMVLILLVGVKWDLLPFSGMQSIDHDSLSPLGQLWDSVKHYILITFCFTFGHWAYYSRFVRQNLLEVIRLDYIRTARAKGLKEGRVVLLHAFTNSLIPLITLLGLTFPFVLSGSVILETMFNWPGIGRLYFQSVLMRDYPTIMALSFITAVLVLLGTLLADLAYCLVDPRVSYD